MSSFAPIAGNGTIPAPNGSTPIDTLMNTGSTLAYYTDARILLPILVIILSVVLRIHQILVAKRTLAVLQDIKEGRNILRVGGSEGGMV
ncbi:hypothetical protein LTR12_007197 [Friedmanniomyces endolithicus]|nr:hypothetical protein LTR74_013971 [Friedmanniomyces endolithicus]KAK1818400.1 hypothetical protein LTR12_007197 [Friedmanniomyces endolithicus]